MTISYSDNFGKLLLRWKGSLWKSIWKDLLIFLLIYYAINFVYRFLLNQDQRAEFRSVVRYCEIATGYIPLTFLLGFFVSNVVTRWWDQCKWIPRPDKFVTLVTTYIRGDTYLVLRRTLARWMNLSSALCWRNLSLRTFKRFPTVQHFVHAGLMTEEELKTFLAAEAPYGKWWIPLVWVCNLLKKCHEEKIIDSVLLKCLIKEVLAFRLCLNILVVYDWVSIPLVYTQVVALATYGYFGICLIGRQIVGDPDIYVPIFTILQFFFFMGWLKVGEDLMNPFGEDDDDFEMNYMLDRNVQLGYMLADDIHGQLPSLQKDLYWGQTNPQIPHTRASYKNRDKIFGGHLVGMQFKEDEMKIITSADDEYSAKNEAAVRKFQDFVLLLAKKPPGSTMLNIEEDPGGEAQSVGRRASSPPVRSEPLRLSVRLNHYATGSTLSSSPRNDLEPASQSGTSVQNGTSVQDPIWWVGRAPETVPSPPMTNIVKSPRNRNGKVNYNATKRSLLYRYLGHIRRKNTQGSVHPLKKTEVDDSATVTEMAPPATRLKYD